jgi:hypothetical protein
MRCYLLLLVFQNNRDELIAGEIPRIEFEMV